MSSTFSGRPEAPDLAVATAHTHVGGVARAGGGPAFPDLHPGDGTVIATIAQTGPELLEEALSGAVGAQPAWAATSPHERARILRAAAELVERDAKRLVALVALDNGKTLAEARGDVVVAAAHLRSAAALAPLLEGAPHRQPRWY